MTTSNPVSGGLRFAMAAFAAIAMIILLPSSASATTPTIVNESNGQWLESGSIGDNGGNSAAVTVSLLVKHDPGRKVTNLKIDDDYDGTDNTTSKALKAVTAQTRKPIVWSDQDKAVTQKKIQGSQRLRLM